MSRILTYLLPIIVWGTFGCRLKPADHARNSTTTPTATAPKDNHETAVAPKALAVKKHKTKKTAKPVQNDETLSLTSNKATPPRQILATGNGYPPFSDKNLPEGGLFTDIVRTVVANGDLPGRIKFMPWSRAEKGTEESRFLAAFPYVKTPDREKRFRYSRPVYSLRALLFTRRDSELRITKLEDLQGKGLILCKPAGYALEPALLPAVEKGWVEVETPDNMNLCIRMLEANRVDAIPESDLVLWPAIDRLYNRNRDAFKTQPYVVQESTLYLIVGRNSPAGKEFLKDFNKSLAALEASNKIQDIIDRHMQDD